jgi:hypothetical protein
MIIIRSQLEARDGIKAIGFADKHKLTLELVLEMMAGNPAMPNRTETGKLSWTQVKDPVSSLLYCPRTSDSPLMSRAFLDVPRSAAGFAVRNFIALLHHQCMTLNSNGFTAATAFAWAKLISEGKFEPNDPNGVKAALNMESSFKRRSYTHRPAMMSFLVDQEHATVKGASTVLPTALPVIEHVPMIPSREDPPSAADVLGAAIGAKGNTFAPAGPSTPIAPATPRASQSTPFSTPSPMPSLSPPPFMEMKCQVRCPRIQHRNFDVAYSGARSQVPAHLLMSCLKLVYDFVSQAMANQPLPTTTFAGTGQQRSSTVAAGVALTAPALVSMSPAPVAHASAASTTVAAPLSAGGATESVDAVFFGDLDSLLGM